MLKEILMPLRIVKEGQIDKPVIVCDQCGGAITDARDGNYHWRSDDAPVGGAEVRFTHKNCCDAFDQLNPDCGAEELDCLLVYLANNLKLDWEAAKRRAALLNSIE